MKSTLAVLGSGTAAALLLYGLLAAVEPRVPPPDDPWLEGWLSAGLKAQFRVVEEDPSKHLIYTDARELFKKAGLGPLPMRRYTVDGANVQVVRLSPEALAEELPAGRHVEFRLKPKGGTVHLCRSGNYLLLVSVKVKVFMLGDVKLQKGALERVFDAFEEAARRWP